MDQYPAEISKILNTFLSTAGQNNVTDGNMTSGNMTGGNVTEGNTTGSISSRKIGKRREGREPTQTSSHFFSFGFLTIHVF